MKTYQNIGYHIFFRQTSSLCKVFITNFLHLKCSPGNFQKGSVDPWGMYKSLSHWEQKTGFRRSDEFLYGNLLGISMYLMKRSPSLSCLVQSGPSFWSSPTARGFHPTAADPQRFANLRHDGGDAVPGARDDFRGRLPDRRQGGGWVDGGTPVVI